MNLCFNSNNELNFGFVMEIKGNILEILQEKTGTSEKGDWRKQVYFRD